MDFPPVPQSLLRVLLAEDSLTEERMSSRRRSPLVRYTAAVLIVAAFLALRHLVDPVIGDESPYVVMLAGVMLAAWCGGLGPGLLAVALAALGVDYFFIKPAFTLFGDGVFHDSRVVLFLLEGAFVSWMTERLHQARQRHEESERRLAAADLRKDEFLAVLAHELRNPLATIRHAVTILQNAQATATQSARARDTIERQIQHLGCLIDDILDVSRITRGMLTLEKRRIDLREAVSRAVEQCRPHIDARRHSLIVSIPQTPVKVDGDLIRLTQVVSNLLTNASKYTDDGGQIRLTVSRDEREAALSVRDNGIGMTAEMLPRVFQMFAQSQRTVGRSQGGLGLGLTVVRSVVEVHGGSVLALSAGPRQGSEFLVRLPLAQGDSSVSIPVLDAAMKIPTAAADREQFSAAQPPAERAATRTTGVRVLVVDDNEELGQSLVEGLRSEGFELRFAANGRIAVEVARAFHPHVALLDLHLPDIDGCEVARKIRSQDGGRAVRLVALTGLSGDDVVRRTREAGFDIHLQKPVKTSQIVAVLLEENGNSLSPGFVGERVGVRGETPP